MRTTNGMFESVIECPTPPDTKSEPRYARMSTHAIAATITNANAAAILDDARNQKIVPQGITSTPQ